MTTEATGKTWLVGLCSIHGLMAWEPEAAASELYDVSFCPIEKCGAALDGPFQVKRLVRPQPLGEAVRPGDTWEVRNVREGDGEYIPGANPPVHYPMELVVEGPWSLEPGEKLVRAGELADWQAKAEILREGRGRRRNALRLDLADFYVAVEGRSEGRALELADEWLEGARSEYQDVAEPYVAVRQ